MPRRRRRLKDADHEAKELHRAATLAFDRYVIEKWRERHSSQVSVQPSKDTLKVPSPEQRESNTKKAKMKPKRSGNIEVNARTHFRSFVRCRPSLPTSPLLSAKKQRKRKNPQKIAKKSSCTATASVDEKTESMARSGCALAKARVKDYRRMESKSRATPVSKETAPGNLSKQRAKQIVRLENDVFALKNEYNQLKQGVSEYSANIATIENQIVKEKEQKEARSRATADILVSNKIRAMHSNVANENTQLDPKLNKVLRSLPHSETKVMYFTQWISRVKQISYFAAQRRLRLRHMLKERKSEYKSRRIRVKTLENQLLSVENEIKSRIKEMHGDQDVVNRMKHKLRLSEEVAWKTKIKWIDALEDRRVHLAENIEIYMAERDCKERRIHIAKAMQEKLMTDHERKKLKMQSKKVNMIRSQVQNEAEKYVPYKRALQRISKATGLGTIDEVLDAYSTQASRREDLTCLRDKCKKKKLKRSDILNNRKNHLNNIQYFGMDSMERDSRRETMNSFLEASKIAIERKRKLHNDFISTIGAIEGSISGIHNKFIFLLSKERDSRPLTPFSASLHSLECVDNILGELEEITLTASSQNIGSPGSALLGRFNTRVHSRAAQEKAEKSLIAGDEMGK